MFLNYGASQYYVTGTRREILENQAIFTSLGYLFALCVPGKNIGCSGSVLPMLPTFFNSALSWYFCYNYYLMLSCYDIMSWRTPGVWDMSASHKQGYGDSMVRELTKQAFEISEWKEVCWWGKMTVSERGLQVYPNDVLWQSKVSKLTHANWWLTDGQKKQEKWP